MSNLIYRNGSEDLIGKKFDYLTVNSEIRRSPSTPPVVDVICDCGKSKTVNVYFLIKGDVRSCGCLVSKMVKKASFENSQKIEAFNEIKNIREWSLDPRCNVSFKTLFSRINQYKWNPEQAIICNPNFKVKAKVENGNINKSQQRNGKLIIAFGETKNLIDWSRDERCKVGYDTLLSRLFRTKKKWESEEAIITPTSRIVDDNFIGKFFGDLLVKSLFNRDSRGKSWECLCSCGNTVFLKTNSLTRGNRTSCGCQNYRKKKFRETKKLNKTDFNTLVEMSIYKNYQRGAIARNLQFEITLEDFVFLIRSNCCYCNCNPSNKQKYLGEIYNYNGIDRVDSDIGYIRDNCVPCCFFCNSMKLDRKKEDFLKKISEIYNFYIKK